MLRKKTIKKPKKIVPEPMPAEEPTPPAEEPTPEVPATPSPGPIGGAEKQKAYFESQPKVAFIIPLADGESPDSYEYVNINGYEMKIKKGVMVTIPKGVAKLLAESYRMTAEAGQAFLASRTGAKEALSE